MSRLQVGQVGRMVGDKCWLGDGVSWAVCCTAHSLQETSPRGARAKPSVWLLMQRGAQGHLCNVLHSAFQPTVARSWKSVSILCSKFPSSFWGLTLGQGTCMSSALVGAQAYTRAGSRLTDLPMTLQLPAGSEWRASGLIFVSEELGLGKAAGGSRLVRLSHQGRAAWLIRALVRLGHWKVSH